MNGNLNCFLINYYFPFSSIDSSDTESEKGNASLLELKEEEPKVVEPFLKTGFRNPLYFLPLYIPPNRFRNVAESSKLSIVESTGDPPLASSKPTRKSSRPTTTSFHLRDSVELSDSSSPEADEIPAVEIVKQVEKRVKSKSSKVLGKPASLALEGDIKLIGDSDIQADDSKSDPSDFEYEELKFQPKKSRKRQQNEDLTGSVKSNSSEKKKIEGQAPKKRKGLSDQMPILRYTSSISPLRPPSIAKPISPIKRQSSPPDYLKILAWRVDQDELLIQEMNFRGRDWAKILARHGSRGSITRVLQGKHERDLEIRAQELQSKICKFGPKTRAIRDDW